uniref:Uncharacterized protein n=1 Tax=Branchiostoma floridae TaxID=7739 RepID=C3XVQ5_BRAFL|eukprot:XP_002611839.1 hypothetical protein BRAFLDRAFT_83137 [Branchiostoma floridae]
MQLVVQLVIMAAAAVCVSSAPVLECKEWADWIASVRKHPKFDKIMKLCAPDTCKDTAFRKNKQYSKYCTYKRVEEDKEGNIAFDLDSLSNEDNMTEVRLQIARKINLIEELISLLNEDP